MSHARHSRPLGFALLEALIALLLISIGLLAVSKLQTLSLLGSGEGRARTEAANISQERLEELRNLLQKGDFTALAGGTATVPGSNASYTLTWTVTPDASLEQHLVQMSTTWTDTRTGTQRLDLNSLVAWDDPGAQSRLAVNTSKSLISPTGEALRGPVPLPENLPHVANLDGTKTYTDSESKRTYLTDANDVVLLYLPPDKDGEVQSFTTITGRVYFDQNAGNNALPSSADVKVRLSSEGECVYNNATANLTAISAGSNSYTYFTYTCYVGPGWYGNVGVTVLDNNGSGPKICVGDPAFNGGVSNSTLTSAHPVEAGVRTYRGFRSVVGGYRSTGVLGGRFYGYSYLSNGSGRTGPFDGRPRPSDYPAYYGAVTAGSTGDYLNQDFLLTKASPSTSCASKMAGGVFARNAGKYVCISPDLLTEVDDECPGVWPGFESEVGSGGSINFSLTVTLGGNGNGTVTSSVGNIDCGTACSASYATGTSVTLTASPDGNSTFAGWSGGGCSGTGTCVVNMSTGQTVAATFTNGVNPPPTHYMLTVNKAGPGNGTVSSSPTGINGCDASCSAAFNANTTVTLTASAGGGSVFTGWSGGGCSGTGTCTVTMSAAQSVTATFGAGVCTTPISGSAHDKNGTVTATPSTYGSCAMNGGNSSNYSCSFNAPAGTTIRLTNSRSAGGNSYSYDLNITANCASQANVNFP
jgi:hypothetical protein